MPRDTKNPVFFKNVASIITEARKFVGRTADVTMSITYFEIGRMIIEEEQKGKSKAEYGKKLIPELSNYLKSKFGKVFSETNLKSFRKFYQIYNPLIRQLLTAELTDKNNIEKNQLLTAEFNPFKLGWTHYQILMRIKDENARNFYEIECLEQQWTVDILKRHYHSSLYERLILSRDKDEVMRLAIEGQTINKPKDLIKNPLVLEFLGLDESIAYSELELESAIITHLQKFLLELGKGFLFEARQKRFTFDEKHFFVDLVFYNRLLQCYVLIDLKINEMTHQDLGQLQMYVNYFDRYVKKDYEKPTVGILLCQEKSDLIVRLTLPENSNIYASEYSLYLPDKKMLQEKIAEWTDEFEAIQVAKDVENHEN